MIESGCLICGEDLVYLQEPEPMMCEICGSRSESNASCTNGHFICDKCHMSDAYDLIERTCLNSSSTSPKDLAIKIMQSPLIKMHGPEHHFLVPAVLITAYYNILGQTDLTERKLKIAKERSRNVLGGYCGFFGTCGAAVGTGIFMSIILNSTPLMVEEWKKSNMLTSEALKHVAIAGGPRCCKRDTFIALDTAISYIREKLNVILDNGEITCGFSEKNKECKETACKYFGHEKSNMA